MGFTLSKALAKLTQIGSKEQADWTCFQDLCRATATSNVRGRLTATTTRERRDAIRSATGAKAVCAWWSKGSSVRTDASEQELTR